MKPVLTAGAIVLLAMICTPLAAEQIVMRNGQVYNGRIVNQTRTEVVLDTPAGRIVLRKADIRRITYGPTAEDKAREEEKKRIEEQKREEARKADELKKQQDQKAAEDASRKRDEDKKAREEADRKKQENQKNEEARKAEELKKQEEARKLEESRKQDSSRNAEELRRQEELRKQQEAAREEEKRRMTEEEIRQRIRDEVKREVEAAEARRRAEEQRAREEAMRPKVTRGGAFARSLFVPGWGQVYQGRKVGFFYGAAFFGLAAVSRQQDIIYNARQSNYEDSARNFLFLTPFVTRILGYAQTDFEASSVFFLGYDHNQRAYLTYQEAARKARFARGALLGLYAWNLVDVLVFHKDQNTSMSLGTNSDSLQFAFHYRF